MKKLIGTYEKKRRDCVISTFTLFNDRGMFAPLVNMTHEERHGHRFTYINMAANRAYITEFSSYNGEKEYILEQATAESHLIMRILVVCLMVCGCGLFKFNNSSRIFIKKFDFEEWICESLPNVSNDMEVLIIDQGVQERIADWYQACNRMHGIRRSLEDVYNAMCMPTEAPFFLYRALEWIVVTFDIKWENLPDLLEMQEGSIKDFKKFCNHPDIGVRHARKTGAKLRVSAEEMAALCADALCVINNIRKIRDPSYKPISNHDLAMAIFRCSVKNAYNV